jgi:uncharacterized membrane protein
MEDFEVLWQAITRIEAQNTLVELSVQDWSHLKKEQRQKLHKQLHKQAYPELYEKKKPQSTKDIFNMLAGAMNG